MADTDLRQKYEATQKRLQEEITANKKLQSEFAKLEKREKAAEGIARVFESKLEIEKRQHEVLRADHSRFVENTKSLLEQADKRMQLIQEQEDEKQVLYKKCLLLEEELKAAKLGAHSDVLKQVESVQTQLQAFDEHSKQIQDENVKLKAQLGQMAEYVKLLEKKHDAELRHKALELQVAQAKEKELQSELAASQTREVRSLKDTKEAMETFKKALKEAEGRYKELQDRYVEASKLAVLQGQLLELEKKKGVELEAKVEEEKGKALKLSALSKTLAKQRADLSAQVTAYSAACAAAGLSIDLPPAPVPAPAAATPEGAQEQSTPSQ